MNYSSYLIQVNIYLILFYAFYALVLQNETFFKWNRTFLVSSGALSFLIPVMQFEWVKSLFVTENVEYVTQVITLNELQVSTPAEQSTQINWLWIIYFTGVAVCLFKFIWQLSQVSKSFEENVHAHSFFNKIKVSDKLPSRSSIVKHEEVHASQLHSADVLFFELISIINWFNPVVYVYKKSVKYIHEFIADEVAATENGKSEYALLLVSNVFGIQKEQLLNNFFNQSLLKKRIAMLHKTKSKKTALLKYGFFVPLFAAMIIFSSAASDNNVSGLENVTSSFASKNATTASGKISANSNPVDTTVLKSKLPFQPDTTTTFNVATIDVMPEYPGGMKAFYEWVGRNYIFPKEAWQKGVSGRVVLTFIVEKDGKLSQIKRIGRDLGYGTGEEAVRVISSSVNWKPGIKNGKPVRVSFGLPLILNAPNDKGTKDSVHVKIGGKNTLDSANPPLVLLDGKEISSDELNKLNPNNIQSVTVLKDKAKTAEYGKKGKNGVIVVISKVKP